MHFLKGNQYMSSYVPLLVILRLLVSCFSAVSFSFYSSFWIHSMCTCGICGFVCMGCLLWLLSILSGFLLARGRPALHTNPLCRSSSSVVSDSTLIAYCSARQMLGGRGGRERGEEGGVGCNRSYGKGKGEPERERRERRGFRCLR